MISIDFRKLILVILIFILSFVLFTFIFRDILVSSIIAGKVDHFNATSHAGVKVEKVRVKWLASLMMTGITVKPDARDTLLKLDTAYVSVNGWKLLAGRLVLQDMILKNIAVTAVKKREASNYDFLFTKKELKDDTAPGEIDYAYATDRLTGLVFDKVPLRIRLQNVKASVNADGHLLSLTLDRFVIEDHMFHSPLVISENDCAQTWTITGMIDRDIRRVTIRIYPEGPDKAVLPFISFKWNARMAFDTVFLSVNESRNNDSITRINGTISLAGFDLDQQEVSTRVVSLDKLFVNYHVNIGHDYLELDSSSRVSINNLDLNPYIRYRTRPARQISLSLHRHLFPAEDLFSSLPEGLFDNLEGIKVKGKLSFDLDFFVDLSIPDSLTLSSELKRHQFTVLSYGNNDLAKINTDFSYTAYEKGNPVRTFIAGKENPDFRPIDRISPFLKASILTSEDPGFYRHRGFIQDAFRESIITNIKERKFARGGSTISMQLVKNVYLNRNKNFARKFEEMLLVWLIENQELCTKDRMFEVYLNIIEWGPLIYGANEAARFYFNKDASKLNLAESIFLASIIPKPKWFRYSFDKEGHLLESNKEYFQLLSGKMLDRGLITRQEYDQMVPNVVLKGPARLLINKNDTLPADSLLYPFER